MEINLPPEIVMMLLKTHLLDPMPLESLSEEIQSKDGFMKTEMYSEKEMDKNTVGKNQPSQQLDPELLTEILY